MTEMPPSTLTHSFQGSPKPQHPQARRENGGLPGTRSRGGPGGGEDPVRGGPVGGEDPVRGGPGGVKIPLAFLLLLRSHRPATPNGRGGACSHKDKGTGLWVISLPFWAPTWRTLVPYWYRTAQSSGPPRDVQFWTSQFNKQKLKRKRLCIRPKTQAEVTSSPYNRDRERPVKCVCR